MVYETDFYTTRRPYRATPSLSTYTISSPRYYAVRDSPDRGRRAAEEQYSYSYSSTTESRAGDPYSRPTTRSYTSTDRVNRSSGSGPGGYSYSSDRSSRSSGDGPGGYQASYSSTSSGRLPGGTSYRHYSYRSEPSRQVRLLPGLGKVHVVHTYDRIVPYVGHKKLTVVSSPPVVVRLRPSTLYREYDRIENKLRPISYNSYTNDYLNSDSHVRIVYVRNPISSSYPIYRSSNLYTTRYYPSYASYYYYPSYLSSYYPTYYPFTPTTRFYSTYSYYPSYRWYDLALYPSWRYNHFARMFDDETRLIRAQTASLLQRIHHPVPRKTRPMPLPYVSRYEEVPARLSNDNYIHRMLISSPSSKSEYTTYYTDPVRKYFGQGRLACITLVGDKSQPRRRNVYMYQDPVRNDIQLLSYYITKFRDEKAALAKPIKATGRLQEQQTQQLVLSPIRPSRIFSVPKPLEDTTSEELQAMKEQRAARLAKITVLEDEPIKPKSVERAKKASEIEAKAKKEAEAEAKAKKEAEAAAKAKKEEEAKSKAKAEEEAKKAAEEAAAKKAADEAAAKKAAEEAAKEEAARKEKEAKEAAERAAELERAAEQARQEELAKQAEIERVKQEEEEKARLEEEKRLADEAKAEEERQQLLRLEEIARQAEEEKEAELARQAEELAELARQEAELAEQAKKEEDEAEQERKAAEAADLEKKQAELEELSEVAKQETELAEQARIEADEAQREAEIAEQQVNETAEEAPAEEESAPAEEDPTPAEAEEEEEEE